MDTPATLQWLGGLAWLRIDLLLRLILAAILGGAVGIEREISGKPAGFRTNLLICVGAALLMELSIGVAALADPLTTNADPARIAAQIVSGIGFLGAGTIIQARGGVVGLTTAATLWVVAAIGMAVGARAYVEAVGTTVLVMIALLLLGRVESLLLRRREEQTIQVVLTPGPDRVQRTQAILAEAGFRTDLLDVERGADYVTVTFQATGPRTGWGRAVEALLAHPAVRRVAQL